jgi:hypothetical protein
MRNIAERVLRLEKKWPESRQASELSDSELWRVIVAGAAAPRVARIIGRRVPDDPAALSDAELDAVLASLGADEHLPDGARMPRITGAETQCQPEPTPRHD